MAKTAGRPPRSESDIAEYRSKIAKQALAIYRAEGFDAVSMRRLAKEVGCAPMTIYAHFEGKQDILRYLWADVLADMSNEIQGKLERIDAPAERLQLAAQTFVSYWVDHPDHFRLNTIRDYPWTDAKMMTDRLLTSIISPIDTAS